MTQGVFPASAVSGGANFKLLNPGGTLLQPQPTHLGSGINTVSVSGMERLLIIVTSATNGVANSPIGIVLNNDTSANYAHGGQYVVQDQTANNYGNGTNLTNTYIPIARNGTTTTAAINGVASITGCKSGGLKMFTANGSGGSAGGWSYNIQGIYNSTASISNVTVYTTAGNFTGGIFYVYGSTD